jgi:hypothetical protein
VIDDPKALQRLMDDYADGRLDPEHMCALVEQLRHSEPAREQLAVVAVAERLLRAAGQGGVPAGRIMAHLAEAGVLPADPDVPPRRSGRRRNTMRRAAGAGLRARAVASARDRNVQTHRRLPLWLLLGVLVAAAVAVGLWRQGRQKERAAQLPPTEPRRSRDAASAVRPAPVPLSSPAPAVPTGQPATARVERAVAPAVPSVMRSVPAEPLVPSSGEVLPPPMGDGSDDPGFVPPPPRVRERRPAAPQSSAAGETPLTGGGTTPMAAPEARTPPKPPAFVTKIKEE